MNAKKLLTVFVFSVAIAVASYCHAGDLQGTGDNFGRGWRQDSSGNLQGTGDNFGKGWRQK